jgi:hypothetical protein
VHREQNQNGKVHIVHLRYFLGNPIFFKKKKRFDQNRNEEIQSIQSICQFLDHIDLIVHYTMIGMTNIDPNRYQLMDVDDRNLPHIFRMMYQCN